MGAPDFDEAHETTTAAEPIHDNHANHADPAHTQAALEDDARDDFGLPRNAVKQRLPPPELDSEDEEEDNFQDANDGDAHNTETQENKMVAQEKSMASEKESNSVSEEVPVSPKPTELPPVVSAEPTPVQDAPVEVKSEEKIQGGLPEGKDHMKKDEIQEVEKTDKTGKAENSENAEESNEKAATVKFQEPETQLGNELSQPAHQDATSLEDAPVQESETPTKSNARHAKQSSISEWSHQRLAPKAHESEEEDEGQWQTMETIAEYDVYDDWGKLIAKGVQEEDLEEAAYGGLGGAGKGYTRVQLDEDAKSATSMDDNTNYLFKDGQQNSLLDEEQRDAVSQLEATKDLLTEGQRIAYVGVIRLTIYNMTMALESAKTTKRTKKDYSNALESMKKWGQQMMVRLYAHMDINSAEQIMIEQLAEHGVQPADLVPPLMQNARVNNPMAGMQSPRSSIGPSSPSIDGDYSKATSQTSLNGRLNDSDSPEHLEIGEGDVPQVQTPTQMTHDARIDLDLRWTVLCDLFLVLIADSAYDSRSRRLLEQVGAVMDISWTQICRFEKRVIDALEMQEEKDKENWNEDDHLETRRKKSLKHKYIVMGLATVGGGLVIGLSAGLLAPVIGAGLAAGFTTIGVTGTAGFLGGVGGAALITSAATAAGGTIAVRASHRRTGHVKTFEYRPLHNNKRLNLIVTVSGWMSGKVDDVRLPYSTVDPIMGDIYSLLWEPEMLTSMGDTINILATEALTQTVQQVLGSTILVALMASIQLPVVLTKLAYLIDNPWTVSLDRANAAGLILADSLIDRHLGNRPVTLVGFSLGSRLIFSCLKELANRGAYGLVQNVYLFGSPIVANKDEYLRVRTAVSGRFVNGYASNDWILGYLFRATSGGIMRVAGLAPVTDIPDLENIDVTSMVNGHMAYRAAMPRLLREVGWEVESDEFTEIEDPDPEDHAKRQRELIREIDEARKEAEAKPEKTRFGFFKKGKLAEKKGWETYEYDANAKHEEPTSPGNTEPNVLFDIDAIKRELESEMIEVKQLESTLPPMKLDLNSPSIVQNGFSHTSSPDPSRANSSPRLTPPVAQASTLAARPKETELAVPRKSFTDSYSRRSFSDENGISMSFEPEYQPPREFDQTFRPLNESSSVDNMGDHFMSTRSRGSTPPLRPDLKTHATMPIQKRPSYSSFGMMNPERNAWADDDGFGGEGEIKMTFE